MDLKLIDQRYKQGNNNNQKGQKEPVQAQSRCLQISEQFQ